MKLLFIGGYPKGRDEPFSIETQSGRMLRRVVAHLQTLYDFDVGYYDMWRNKHEEKQGIIRAAEKSVLLDNRKRGIHLIPLGHHLQRSFLKVDIPVEYYPHPARHSSRLLKVLEADIAFWMTESKPTAEPTPSAEARE